MMDSEPAAKPMPPKVMNPALYCVLRHRFGTVKVSHQCEPRVETYSKVEKRLVPVSRGEHYAVCCPLCGDRRFRLSISYKWLTYSPWHFKPRTDLIHCYNENCDVRSPEFYTPFLEMLEMHALRLPPFTDDYVQRLMAPVTPVMSADGRPGTMLRESQLPGGCVPLRSLARDHEAWSFLKQKYHESVAEAVADVSCNAMFCQDSDDPHAHRRIIFPVMFNGACVGWQGRAIDAEAEPRWYLSPGFLKCIYRHDDVLPVATPVIAEGIMSALACGLDRGVAIFGKTLTSFQLQLISQRWETVILATDPETYVPNAQGVIDVLELKHRLDAALRQPARLIPWPQRVLDIARQKHCKAVDWVPDPADFGIPIMSELISRASPHVSLQ